MQVRLLGPVDVTISGVPHPVPGLRRRALLAALALQPGQIISTDQLMDMVWPDTPSVSANTLQSHISRLRRLVTNGATITASPPGYVLRHPGEATDIETAERLIRSSAQAPNDTDRAQRLRRALALWRGQPLADLHELGWWQPQATRLDQLWLDATLSLVDTRLALGEHNALIPELDRLVRDHPLNERIHAQLMLALYRADQQADALATYQRLRRSLADDLGIDPSQTVRDLHVAILGQDRALDSAPPPSTMPSAATAAPVPAQLPAAIRTFAGRDSELAHLDHLLDTDQHPAEGTATIVCISGTAGVGKTTLAVQWAHRVRHRFPGGSLYVNLRGFDPNCPPTEPADVIRSFLHALAVPADRIPTDLSAQAALYRSLIAEKRVLIVADNARDAEQVRPLLPGSSTSLIIITSRNQLSSLVATDGAHPSTLDLLTPAEARQLLVNRLGADRVNREPDAVDDIIAGCARLPLALAIVAARAAIHPTFPLGQLAADLQPAAAVLDALHGGDPIADVRAAFQWSYQELSRDAARLFRLLGLHPGPDLTVLAAASLADIPAAQARTLLAELAAAQLVAEHVPGRYAFHDLLRHYANEECQRHDSADSRNRAIHRCLDHYLRTAYAGAILLDLHRNPVALPEAQPGSNPQPITDVGQALAWFTAEHPVLVAAVSHARQSHFPGMWQLAWTLTPYLQRQGHLYTWVAVQASALEHARHTNDRTGQAHIHRSLGVANSQLRRDDVACRNYQDALRLLAEIGDTAGQAQTHFNLAWLAEQQGNHTQALHYGQLALALYRTADHAVGQARAINSIGWNHALLGNHHRAIGYCERALTMLQDLDDIDGQACAMDGLGYAYHNVGDHDRAIDYFQRSLTLVRQDGNRYSEWKPLVHMSAAYRDVGDIGAARESLQAALDILDSLGHPQADAIRVQLGTLSADPTPARRSALPAGTSHRGTGLAVIQWPHRRRDGVNADR